VELTHVDAAGAARMVDVTGKEATARTAVATGTLRTTAEVVDLLRRDGLPKGDAVATARIAGIMAAKRTPDLIPLCHPLALTSVTVELTPDRQRSAIDIAATCRLKGRTGVEMEALTAVSVAALTIYDMAKAVDRGMRITDIRLLHKSGGKSGTYEAAR
jgi:cyclic pyranopterin monophosphate synthase